MNCSLPPLYVVLTFSMKRGLKVKVRPLRDERAKVIRLDEKRIESSHALVLPACVTLHCRSMKRGLKAFNTELVAIRCPECYLDEKRIER